MGGLLVALAAVGTWWTAAGAGSADGTRYVVAARALEPGAPIEADDVRLATLDLPPALRGAARTDLAEVVGRVALGPVAGGELVQAGALAPAVGSPTAREVSFAVETDWAVAGALQVGDRIDVLATTEGAAEPASRRVLADATVRRLTSSGGDGLGEHRTQIITVTVEGAEAATDLVTAARAATITVVRVTGGGG